MENNLVIEIDKDKLSEKHMEGSMHDLQESICENFKNFLDVVEGSATDLGFNVSVETKIKVTF